MFNKNIFSIIILNLLITSLLVSSVSAQKIVLRGRVLDVNTHYNIGDVNIYIKGTEIGTTSDFSGFYSLDIPDPVPEMIIVFRHIGYEIKETTLNQIRTKPNIYLQPRVIPMRELDVEALGTHLGIEKDLPQPISIFEAEAFEIRGYVDAADLLRSDHSIQVEEQLSGKKTISIRAGNPDDVIVLYNGTKLNSTYNNIFDFSLINLEDVERIEIVKGSNTALYGSEAFSGIINIVPRIKQNYNIRFQQRFGTYDSGNWGVNLYKGFKGLHGSYSYIQGASRRKFLDDELLENQLDHHGVNLFYDFSRGQKNERKNVLSASFIQSNQEYMDYRDNETLSNFNQVVLFRYKGDISILRKLDLLASHYWWDESQVLLSNFGTVDRFFQDRSFHLSGEKRINFKLTEFLVKYEFEKGILNFTDERILTGEQSVGLEGATLSRKRYGLVTIIKLHDPSSSETIRVTDFDISFRYDKVIDNQQNEILRNTNQDSLFGLFDEHVWDEMTFKISTHFSGSFGRMMFNSYMNYGTNIKFPTLFQQISSPETIWSDLTRPNLDPEKNTGLEIGFELTGNTSELGAIEGYQISTSVFRNFYENKLRVSFPVGIPVAFYDNVVSAKLSGFEMNTKFFLFQKKVTFEFAFSLYSVSDKAAFPFKSEKKVTSNLMIDHAGYSLKLHWFNEGEQVGWIRQETGEFTEVVLPDFSNLDLHFSKSFEWKRAKLFLNASGRNLLNKDVILQGLAIRDRRYYLTLGVQL